MGKKLLEAARSGDLTGLRKIAENKGSLMDKGLGMLRSKPPLNSSDIRGKTALIYAATFGHRTIVEYLLSKPPKDVDVNAVDDTKKTALHHAVKRRGYAQSEIVDLLLQKRALLEAQDHNGCTPLMFAVANGDEAVTRGLLKALANVNAKDVEGNGPLDYAVNFGQSLMAQLLRDAGAEAAEHSATEEEGEGDDDEDEQSAEPETAHPFSGHTSPANRESPQAATSATAAADIVEDEDDDVESVELAARAAAAASTPAKKSKKKKSVKHGEDAGDFNPPPREG